MFRLRPKGWYLPLEIYLPKKLAYEFLNLFFWLIFFLILKDNISTGKHQSIYLL